MIIPADTATWPLAQLADCANCGGTFVPRVDVPEGRFYGCGCPAALDADELDDAVGTAVLEHLIARMRSLSFSAEKLRAAWRRATPTVRRAVIVTELATVTVTRTHDRVQLATTWHTDRSPAIPPPIDPAEPR